MKEKTTMKLNEMLKSSDEKIKREAEKLKEFLAYKQDDPYVMTATNASRFPKAFAEALKSKESRRIVDSGVADESGECMLDGNEYSSMKRGAECYLLEKSPNSAIIVEDGPGRTMVIFINRAQFLKEIA